MHTAKLRFFLVLWIATLGALTAGWTTTWNIANGASTATIQSTINGSAAGDTIAFSAGGSYSITTPITVLGSRTYTGQNCTMSWTGSGPSYGYSSSLFYLSNVSNLSISGFTFNGDANGGNVYINTGCSYVTITGNVFENNTYVGGSWGAQAGLYLADGGDNGGTSGTGGLTNSTISYNTFQDMSTTPNSSSDPNVGIYFKSPSQVSIIDNNFNNIENSDCIQGAFNNTTTATGMVFSNNVGTTNCSRFGLEMGGWGTYPTVSGMQIENNIFTIAYGDGGDTGGAQGALSLVSQSTGDLVEGNILTLVQPLASGGNGCLELYGGDGHAGMPMNCTVQNNVICTAATGTQMENGTYTNNCYNYGITAEYNLFENVGTPFSEGSSVNIGGAADVYLNNWSYDGTIAQSGNTNLSGHCPTMSIAETSNATIGGANGTFTITSSLAPSQNTAVYYTLSGTGVNGTDYTITPASPATIASGQTSTTLSVTGINSGKTVIATLAFGPYYINSASNSATMNINAGGSLPTVTVAASPTSINEASGSSTYTFTRTGATTSALTVSYAMSGAAVNGTDYTTLSGSMTIASGSSTGTVTLTALDRQIVSGSKTAILTISTNANYTVGSPSNATVTINDNDTSAIPTGNLQFWVKGDTGVTYDGGNNVSKWSDLSGNGMDATQSTTGDYPLYVAGDMNGEPGIRFNGSSDYLNMPAGFANFTAGTSIFIVANPSAATNNARFIEFCTGQAANAMTLCRNGTANDLCYYVYNSSWVDVLASGAIPINTAYLLEDTQDASGNLTLYKRDINGYPGIHFNGSSDYLSMPSGFANFTNGASIFVVAAPSAATNNARFIEMCTGHAANAMTLCRNGTSNDLAYYVYNSAWVDVLASGAIPTATSYLLEMVQTSSGGTTLYKNATSLATGTIAVPNNVTRTLNYIGKSDYSGDALYQGDIVEIIVYNSALSTTDRQNVENYLYVKYNL